MGRQVVAFVLALIGFLGTVLILGLPKWKMSAFIGANIVTAQTIWEGLWMNCVTQSTGQMQCKVYDSMLALPADLQAARALVCVSVAVGAVAIAMTIVGAGCTSFLRHDAAAKSKVGMAACVVFIVVGLVVLIPVSWSASSTISGFHSSPAQWRSRGELGACIYLGWASGALLLIGGGTLCSTFSC